MRPRVLHQRLALVSVGTFLTAATIALGVDRGFQFILQLAAMLILSGAIAFVLLLGTCRLYEWWADR